MELLKSLEWRYATKKMNGEKIPQDKLERILEAPQEEPKQETLNKINNMNEEIKKQINLLEEEQTRVKQFINENNFNCTTAPYVIAKQYRDEIKKHIGILKMNLEN
jgi:cell division protein FtsB